jgi:uncharacterized protein YbjT (DUF2867 family)
MILVAGSTGLVGSTVCRRLRERGETVRALVRGSSSVAKVHALRAAGAEICVGDLKDPESIAAACRGADAVISTASATLSRQAGDSIESVDLAGQINLVEAAKAAGVQRFLFVSFRRPAGFSFPLGEAKEKVERALQSLNFTIIQASWFMEVWLSPALGFDYANGKVRIYGTGAKPVSWVSFHDVAEICAVGLRHRAAERRVIEFGGPEAISPLEVVSRFEAIAGRPFEVEHVPEDALRAQFEQATNSMEKSFAALMLGYSGGDAMEMGPAIETFGLRLTTVADYARGVLAKAAGAD